MKLEIEVYKGQQIYYNDDSDKFECDIDINGNVKSPKRGSLKDLRNEIDQFIKLNLEFKPFLFIEKSSYGDSFYVRKCCGVRKDGTLVIHSIDNENNKSYADKKDQIKFCIYDESIVDEYTKSEKEYDLARQKIDAKRKELYSRLIKMDLSKYQI
jgi:hypothetical protein